MKRLLIFTAMLALSGCASKAPELPPAVRVEIAVPVPCKTKAVEVPAFAAEGLKKTDPLEVKVRALLAERRQRKGYEQLLLAAVAACQ